MRQFHQYCEHSAADKVAELGAFIALSGTLSLTAPVFNLSYSYAIAASSVTLGFLAPMMISLSENQLYADEMKLNAEMSLEILSRMLADPNFQRNCQGEISKFAKVSSLAKYICNAISETGEFPTESSVFNKTESRISAYSEHFMVIVKNHEGETLIEQPFSDIRQAARAYVQVILSQIELQDIVDKD